MKISCVVDNQAGFHSDFYAEHGFSLLIETNKENILLDTAQTSIILKHNLDKLGIESVDKIVLSHGHVDHAGGISGVPTRDGMETKFYLHPEALTPKFRKTSDIIKYIGFPQNIEVSKLNLEVKKIDKPTRIGKNIWIFNQVNDYSHFETIPPYLAIKKDNQFFPDKFNDEINLVIKTNHGLVVLSGCAHKGIVNILYSAREYFQDEIYGVIGGSHLVEAKNQRIQKTIDEFKKLDPQIIALGHCTGFKALCKFNKEFPDKFIPLFSGIEILEELK